MTLWNKESIGTKDYNFGTGVLKGGGLSINADPTKLDIGAGSALIADYTNIDNVILTEVSWPDTVFDPTLASEYNKWIGVKKGADPNFTVGVFAAFPSFTQAEKREYAIIGRCWGNGTTSTIIGHADYATFAYGQSKTAEDIAYAIGSINKFGNVYESNGANLLFNKTAGESFRFSGNVADTTSPNSLINPLQTAIDPFWYILQDGTDTSQVSEVDPNFYDVAGVKTAVPSGKYTIQRMYFYPGSEVNYLTYGQALYSSMGAAIPNIGHEAPVLNDVALDGGILRGWLILKDGATDLTDPLQAHFRPALSLGDPTPADVKGQTPANVAFAFADYGIVDEFYVGGHYGAPAADSTLTIGGTVTETHGDALSADADHFFVVAGGPGGAGLTLTITGVSINDEGVRNDSDSEVLIADCSAASTDEYFETDKKWLGTVTATLTGGSGSFTFNYGGVSYTDMGNVDFIIVDFKCEGMAAANADLEIELIVHQGTGWTYHATAFSPGPDPVLSMADTYGTNTLITTNGYFKFKRSNLSEIVEGSGLGGMMIRISSVTNNAIKFGNILVGVLV